METSSFFIEQVTGADTRVQVTYEDVMGGVRVCIDVDETHNGGAGAADITGVFFDIAGDTEPTGVINTGDDEGITFEFDANRLLMAPNNSNISGGGTARFDLAVGVGNVGGGSDFFDKADFIIQGITVADLENQRVGVRLQSVGPAQAGSSKTVGTECFLPGTLILTDAGERLVEDLKIGDMIQTAEGKLAPIKWIGRQTVQPELVKSPLRDYPVLIKAGALGDNLPKRDLHVSPDHAFLVDGLLINAGALVNDVSIVKTEPTETFTYYHVELDHHALLVVEGTPAESYLPQKEDRYLYDNGAEYEELYPNQCNMILWPLDYPRISSTTTVPRYVRKNLMAIAEQLEGAKELQLV